MANVVGDEMLGKIARQQNDWFRRVREGSLDPESVIMAHQVLQDFADGKLPGLLGLRLGTHEIREMEHMIDCDADPFLPDGWKVEEHQRGGIVKWTQSLISLHLEDGQKNGKWMKGDALRKALKGQKTLNANVLDFLLKHPELIPDEWKNKAVFFWGTIYRFSDGNLCVRYLSWDGDGWHWSYYWLDSDWDDSNPAAVRAS